MADDLKEIDGCRWQAPRQRRWVVGGSGRMARAPLLGGGGEPVGRVGGGGEQSEGGMVAVRPRTMV